MGAPVRIQGDNFFANTDVSFSPSVPATVTARTRRAIDVSIPMGAATGDVTVETPYGFASRAITVIPGIASLTPAMNTVTLGTDVMLNVKITAVQPTPTAIMLTAVPGGIVTVSGSVNFRPVATASPFE